MVTGVSVEAAKVAKVHLEFDGGRRLGGRVGRAGRCDRRGARAGGAGHQSVGADRRFQFGARLRQAAEERLEILSDMKRRRLISSHVRCL